MKQILALLLAAVLLLPCMALAETAYEPLPLGGPAPYSPVEGALSEDGMSYDDGTMSVRIETDVHEEIQVYYVYVTISDKSQLRTATAGNPRSKARAPVYALAEKNNAVLAFNGDFYNYQQRESGVIYRSGQMIRNKPVPAMDLLIVDENADLHIIQTPNLKKVEAFRAEHQIVESFAFGPALIMDGQRLEFNYREKMSCGYPTPDERLLVCQLPDTDGRKQYLFIVCDDPGLTVPQMTELAESKGVTLAYNLDGGTSTALYLCGTRINKIPKNRDVCDILYFATLVPGESK